jgi:hypothetical protein
MTAPSTTAAAGRGDPRTPEDVSAKRGAGRRTTIKNRARTFFAKRTARGRFQEMAEKGRSLKADRRTKAKKATKSGYGDRRDRQQRAA